MFHQRNWLGALSLAGLISAGAPLAAQSPTEGVARVSDKAPATTVSTSSGGGYIEGDCPTCRTHGRHGCKHGLFCDHYCSHSPDHGYSIPQKYPIHRRGVQYQTMFPNQWYGMPGSGFQAAPMVYMPTDTTQLGYYYQHAPSWQPDPSRLPAKPIPAQWHYLAGTAYASQWRDGPATCLHGLRGNCPHCMYGGEVITTPAPTNGAPSPTPLPSNETPPAPVPPSDSVRSDTIRRAGF